MARPKSTTPTPGEIEILHVLWNQDVCTVRDVHQKLLQSRKVAHTTVASMMQLMHAKGLLNLVSQTRPFKYQAAMDLNGAKESLLNDVIQRLFDNSPQAAVLHILKTHRATPQQLAEVEKAIANLPQSSSSPM